MQNGNQEEQLSIMVKFTNSYQYLEAYNDLRDGYYEYWIDGRSELIQTRFSDKSGWMKVVDVDWNSKEHINEDHVRNIKLSDHAINQLRSYHYDSNVMAEINCVKAPFNEWVEYPLRMYVHYSMDRFSSVEYVRDITNANLVSLHPSKNFVSTWQGENNHNIGFGSDHGDTFFAYGDETRDGFVQSFSGAGKGAVFVR